MISNSTARWPRNMLHSTSFFDAFEHSLEDVVVQTKSSKHRRQLINQEIDHIRSLLPMRNSSVQRLSQLEVMSMACIQIRKSHFLGTGMSSENTEVTEDLLAALPGFFLVCTLDGKLVYISNNVTDFLGHSMSDITKQGDNIYDIVDTQDHSVIRDVLTNWTNEEVNFHCRISLSRYTRRQSSFFDEKTIQASGYFMYPSVRSTFQGPVMVTLCVPVLSPAIKSSMLSRTSTTFTSLHNLDMVFVEASYLCEYYLGYTESELVGRSWYEFISSSSLQSAAARHSEVTEAAETGGCCIFHGEMINRFGQTVPVAVSLQGQYEEKSQYIICTVQVLRVNLSQPTQTYFSEATLPSMGQSKEELREELATVEQTEEVRSLSPDSQTVENCTSSVDTALNPIAQYQCMMSSFLPHMYPSSLPEPRRFLHPFLESIIETENSMANYYERQLLAPFTTRCGDTIKGLPTAYYDQNPESNSSTHYTDLTSKPSKPDSLELSQTQTKSSGSLTKKGVVAGSYYDGGYHSDVSPEQSYTTEPTSTTAFHLCTPAGPAPRNQFALW